MQDKVPTTKQKKRTAGRPFGKVARPRIALPDEGEELWPYYTDWAADTGINPKSLQRMRHRMPLVNVAGILYIKNKEGRRALAEPVKSRRTRR